MVTPGISSTKNSDMEFMSRRSTVFKVWNQNKVFKIGQGQFLGTGVKREVHNGAFPGKLYTKCELERFLGSYHPLNCALT